MYAVDTVYGRMLMPSSDDMISRFLAEYGEWSPYEVELAANYFEQGDVVFDAGAYLGTFSLSCAAQRPGRMVCIEANPVIVALLRQNLKANYPGECVVVAAALGGGADAGILGDDVHNLGSAHVVARDTRDAICVQSTTLADVRKEFGDYRLAKLDIEGSELCALKQDQEYLHRAKPTLLIEANENPRTVQVANYCRWLGYRVTYFSYPVFRHDNPKGSRERLFALAHESLLLATDPAMGDVDLPDSLREDGGFSTSVASSNDLIKAMWVTPRWANAEWLELSREQLIARLGQYDQRRNYQSFLSKLTPGSPFGD